MPKYVNVQGHGVVGFPDEMGDDEIQKALAKEFPAPEPGFFRTLGRAAKEAYATGAAEATEPSANRAIYSEAKSPQQRDYQPDLTPGSADMSATEYWRSVAAGAAPPPSLQGNVVDNPELLANPKFYARGLGGLAGGLPFMLEGGLERGRQIQDETGSPVKGAAVGLGETALNLVPFGQNLGRLARAGLFGAASGATPVIEAGARGGDMTQALKEGLTAAVPGAIFGGLLPGGGRGRGLGQPEADFAARVQQLGGEPGAEGPARGLGVPTPEELAGLTERAAETRTLDAMTERRLRTEEGIPPEQAAPEPVRAPEPVLDESGLNPEAEALRREVQASQRGALSDFDRQVIDETSPDPFAPKPPAAAKPLAERLRDPEYRDALTGMRSQTGWAEVGGRGILNPEGYNIGRTTWVPRAEWWKDRPKGLNEGQVKDAIAKGLAGEKLNKREADMLNYMTSWLDEQKARASEQRAQAGEIPGFDEPTGVREPYYHGSPHRFDEFKMQAIGTGEGNQTYGHGLYFAQNKGVATSYRPRGIVVELAKEPKDTFAAGRAMDLLDRFNGDFERARAFAQQEAAGRPDYYGPVVEALNDESNFNVKQTRGALYHVDIPAEATGKMLDHDEFLSKQTPAVQQVAREFLQRKGYLKAGENGPIMLNRAWREFGIREGRGYSKGKGGQLYEALAKEMGGPEKASQYLLSKGIPGLKYLDAGSRTTGSGTRNVVLFDDSLVKVLKVENPRKAYSGAKIEAPDGTQLSLDFATRPDTTGNQVRVGTDAMREMLAWRDRRGSASVLASDLPRQFAKDGTATLVGKQVRNAADLATLAQVYRNPQMEAFRMILTKGDRVVHHSGYTSRLAGAVNFAFEKFLDDLGASMKRLGADGYYLQHNHPAGKSKPSSADIRSTIHAASRVPGFKGHVVLNNQEYSVIDAKGDFERIDAPQLGGYKVGSRAMGADPTVDHALLGTHAFSNTGLALALKKLEHKPGMVTIIGMSGKGYVRAIAEFPREALESRGGVASATVIARLHRFSRGAGSSQLSAVVDSLRDIRPLLESGHITDAITSDGRATWSDAVAGRVTEPNPMQYRVKSIGVTEERQPYRRDTESQYGGTPPEMPGEPRPERVQVGGGDYSLKKYGNLSNEDLGTLTGVMKNLEAPIASQRRGTRTWDATEEAALKLVQDKLGVTLENLVNRKKGSTANAEQLEAYGMVLSKATQEVRQVAEEAARTNSNESLLALAAAREKLGVLIAPAMGYKTEAGRALNILRKVAGQFDETQRILEAMGEGGQEVMRDFARRVRQAGNLDQVIGLTRETYKPTIANKFDEYWVNGLLSGPTTHVVNIASNALFQVLEMGAETLAATGSKHVSMRELGARIVGMQHGVAHGLKNAKQAYITEEPQINPVSKLELERRRAIGGKLGRFIRIPGRALMAEDEFFKAMEYHGELGALAMDEALRTNPKNARAEFDKILGDVQNRPDLIAKALDAADRATFQDRLGPFMQKVSNMRYGHGPAGWFLQKIIPFVRTPTNILKRAVEYTPAAYSMKQVREAISDGGRNRALAVSRMMVGSTVMLGAMGLSAAGKMTGNGPSDPNERALLMRQGWQPYSVKAGDRWVKYNRFDPLGMLMGVAADMYEIGAVGSQGDFDKIGSMAMTSIALNLGDKTFLRGISDFTQAYTDPQRYFDRWAQGLAASLIPNLAAQTARGIDPYMREARTTMDALLAKIPVAREQLATKLDIAGEPIKQEGDFPGNPLTGNAVKDDQLADALLRLGLRKEKPGKKLTLGKYEIDLKPEDYQDFASFTQRTRWKLLTPFVRSPQFQTAMRENPEAAAELLDRQWNAIGKQARQTWIARNPGVLIGAQRQQAAGSDYIRYTEAQP